MTEIIHPGHIHIFRRAEDATWRRREGIAFYRKSANSSTLPTCQADWDLQEMYGISESQVLIELFKVNGGSIGYYLADMHEKRYHYCGLGLTGVKLTLTELGIGLASQPDHGHG